MVIEYYIGTLQKKTSCTENVATGNLLPETSLKMVIRMNKTDETHETPIKIIKNQLWRVQHTMKNHANLKPHSLNATSRTPPKKEGLVCWDYEALSNNKGLINPKLFYCGLAIINPTIKAIVPKGFILSPSFWEKKMGGKKLRPSNTSKTVAVFTWKLGVLDGWMALTV